MNTIWGPLLTRSAVAEGSSAGQAENVKEAEVSVTLQVLAVRIVKPSQPRSGR